MSSGLGILEEGQDGVDGSNVEIDLDANSGLRQQIKH